MSLKIKIARSVSDTKILHVIDKKAHKTKNELDEKSKKADAKRMESLKKMKNSYDQQKSTIQSALAGVVSIIFFLLREKCIIQSSLLFISQLFNLLQGCTKTK